MKFFKIIENNNFLQEWEKKANHPLQSWYWGKAREETGLEVLRIGEFEDDKLENVFQMTIHKTPFLPIKLGYLPRSRLPSKKALDFLAQTGRKKNLAFIKLEPYVKRSDISGNEDFFKSKNLKKSPHPLFTKWTILLDLRKSEEELLANMKNKTRYNIRLAKRKGIVVKLMDNEQGFKIFSKLYFDTCKRQNYKGHTPEYHRIIWQTLKGKTAHILIAFYKNEPLAAYEVFLYKDTLYYPYGGSSLKYRNFMPTNLLMWETILFGKRQGAEIFDMWGSLPPDYDQSHPWAGFTRFKQGYGGEFTEFIGAWDLIIDKRKYRLFSLLFTLRNILNL